MKKVSILIAKLMTTMKSKYIRKKNLNKPQKNKHSI